MSRDYYELSDETGETGFLAGVIDVLSEPLLFALDSGDAIDLDIFNVGDDYASRLNDTVRKRLVHYSSNVPPDKIQKIDLKLKKSDEAVAEFIYSKLKKYSSDKLLLDKINHFLEKLKQYLQEPEGIYEPIKIDKTCHILGNVYLYEAWDYFFISYYDYFVLFIIGTVE